MNKWINDIFTVWTGKDRSHACNHYPNSLVLRATYSLEKVFQEMSWDELLYFSCTDFWQLTRQSPSVQLQFNWKDLKQGTSFLDRGERTIKTVTIYRTTMKLLGSRDPSALQWQGSKLLVPDALGSLWTQNGPRFTKHQVLTKARESGTLFISIMK